MLRKDLEAIIASCLPDSGVHGLDFLHYHNEPEYSFSELKRLEEANSLSTSELLLAKHRGLLDLEPPTVAKWLFNLRIYQHTGGDLEKLFSCQFTVEDDVDGHGRAGRNPAFPIFRFYPQ